jgi:hypothetical protein
VLAAEGWEHPSQRTHVFGEVKSGLNIGCMSCGATFEEGSCSWHNEAAFAKGSCVWRREEATFGEGL